MHFKLILPYWTRGYYQDSVLGPPPLPYIHSRSSKPPNTTIATFADDTAVLAFDYNPTIASQKLQSTLLAV
jgi:hypothetical protein